jgi:hypothetical protein
MRGPRSSPGKTRHGEQFPTFIYQICTVLKRKENTRGCNAEFRSFNVHSTAVQLASTTVQHSQYRRIGYEICRARTYSMLYNVAAIGSTLSL